MNSIKTGATLSASIKLTNNDTRKEMIITENIIFEAGIFDANDKLLATPIITIMDQEMFPGFLTLKVPADITKNWRPGEAFLNIKFSIDDIIIKTDSYKFMIEKDIL